MKPRAEKSEYRPIGLYMRKFYTLYPSSTIILVIGRTKPKGNPNSKLALIRSIASDGQSYRRSYHQSLSLSVQFVMDSLDPLEEFDDSVLLISTEVFKQVNISREHVVVRHGGAMFHLLT